MLYRSGHEVARRASQGAGRSRLAGQPFDLRALEGHVDGGGTGDEDAGLFFRHGTRRGKSTLVQQQLDSLDCHANVHRRTGRHPVEHTRCRAHVTVLHEFEVAQGKVRLHVLRSEEHTSELQSLMRISYAVFCLTKKTPKRYSTI